MRDKGENVIEIRMVVFFLRLCVFYPMKRVPRVLVSARACMYIGASPDVFEQLIFNRCSSSSSISNSVELKHNAIDNLLSNERARRRRVYESRRVKTSDFFCIFFLSLVPSAYHQLLLYC